MATISKVNQTLPGQSLRSLYRRRAQVVDLIHTLEQLQSLRSRRSAQALQVLMAVRNVDTKLAA